jgi:hypothetical protein
MITVDELAFLKAFMAELPQTTLKQLKRDIAAEKMRREAEATTKAKGWGDRSTGQTSGRQTGSAGERTPVPHTAPRATAGKRKADELDWSHSGGWTEPPSRRPTPRPVPVAEPAPLPT